MKAMLVSSCICDGQNQKVINSIAQAIQQVDDVKLIDYSMEPNHNRSMFSFVGAIQPVLEASKKMALRAIELIDMRQHQGNHPRVGAVDAVPFIPVGDTKMSEAVASAQEFGKFMGTQKIPVWFYGEADKRPRIAGANYELVQKALGEYENLPQQLKSKEWPPDEGPREFNAKSGATTVGARGHLVSFNFNLRTDDLSIAKSIAKSIRQSSGGLQNVFAIGVALESKGQVQVSTMTDRWINSPLPLMIKTIRDLAKCHGVSLCETEIAGSLPISIVEDVFKHYLQAHNFSPDQIVEKALID
jgi:glutamate formiminotransferase / 5-formyltetrahydrofolate cyclo-ligase